MAGLVGEQRRELDLGEPPRAARAQLLGVDVHGAVEVAKKAGASSNACSSAEAGTTRRTAATASSGPTSVSARRRAPTGSQ